MKVVKILIRNHVVIARRVTILGSEAANCRLVLVNDLVSHFQIKVVLYMMNSISKVYKRSKNTKQDHRAKNCKERRQCQICTGNHITTLHGLPQRVKRKRAGGQGTSNCREEVKVSMQVIKP